MSEQMITFKIAMPTDQGFLGRQCNSPECSRYFKVHADAIKSTMCCPYCGTQFTNNELWTDDQNEYITDVATEHATEYIHQQINEMFARLARGNSSSVLKFSPGQPYRRRAVSPNYRERTVDSELTCPACRCLFQVFGIFGYCPNCRSQNLKIYDANLEIIKHEIAASTDQRRALRHAYSDVVSTFEMFCKRKAAAFTNEAGRFQVLFDARGFFKEHLQVDMLDGLTTDDLLALRRVFQKRHAYEHYEGIIDDRYIRMIPEDAHLKDQRAELSVAELEQASQAMRKALDRLVQACES